MMQNIKDIIICNEKNPDRNLLTFSSFVYINSIKGEGDRKYIIIDLTNIELTVIILDITNKVNDINTAIAANLTKNNLIAFLNISISNSSSAPMHNNIIGDKGSVKKDIILL